MVETGDIFKEDPITMSKSTFLMSAERCLSNLEATGSPKKTISGLTILSLKKYHK
jgi:hypothetical protein